MNEETGGETLEMPLEAAPSPFFEKAIHPNLWENVRLIFFDVVMYFIVNVLVLTRSISFSIIKSGPAVSYWL